MTALGGDLRGLREVNRLRVVEALTAEGTASRGVSHAAYVSISSAPA
jgi:hypothetical protein